MAEVTIRIPTPLRSFVEDRSEVRVEAEDAHQALERLTEGNPSLRAQLYGDDGRLRRFVNVYLGERNLRDLEPGEAPVEEGSEIRIVPSIAGGASRAEAPGRTDAPERADSPERSEAAPAASRTDGRGPAAGGGDGTLSPDELRRYSRHIMIPEVGREGQEKLKRASVLLVGAGGLGSPLGLYLAAAGVGRLGLVDHDVVDLTNLQRQVLHDTDAVGRPKLASARERIEGLNPHVDVVTYEARLDSENALEVLGDGWDLVVDGSDNFPTRYLVNDASVLLGIPSVYGAIFRFEGQASVFGTPEGPCYRCLFRDPPPPGLVPSCADAGVLGVLPGIVGTIQATEAIKLVLGRGETLAGRLLLIDGLRMEFRELTVRKDPECPVCGEDPSITELIDYELFCGIEAEEEPGGEGAAAGARGDGRGDGVPEIDVSELRRRLEAGEPVRILDIREPYEWEICNLGEQGARLVPLGELPDRSDEVPEGEGPIVVYCRSGARSARAVRWLRDRGHEEAVNLEGGILAWAEEVDPGMPTY